MNIISNPEHKETVSGIPTYILKCHMLQGEQSRDPPHALEKEMNQFFMQTLLQSNPNVFGIFKRCLSYQSVSMDGAALPLMVRFTVWGILSVEIHVLSVARSSFLQLKLVWLLQIFLDLESLATVVHALVT